MIIKLVNIIVLLFLIVSCKTKNRTANVFAPGKSFQVDTLVRDFGFGNEYFTVEDAKQSIVYNNAFSYSKLLDTSYIEPIQVTNNSYRTEKNEIVIDLSADFVSIGAANRKGFRNGINLLGKEISLSSLYRLLGNNEAKVAIFSVNFFSFHGTQYLVLFIAPAVPNSTLINYLGVLIDISDTNPQLVVFPGAQLSSQISCLNDFDTDGKIDLAYLDNFNKEVRLYTLDGDRFLKQNCYLKLEPYIDRYFVVDDKASNWYTCIRRP
ncbi:MAG: hypothetical protein DI535_08115 [Citrobacter freundii]|nr:MAG: hypothetical protein DI535_08115 [Citrobacter freundii]